MVKWNNSVSLPGAYQGSNNTKTQKVTEKTGRCNTNGLLKSNSGAKRPGGSGGVGASSQEELEPGWGKFAMS